MSKPRPKVLVFFFSKIEPCNTINTPQLSCHPNMTRFLNFSTFLSDLEPNLAKSSCEWSPTLQGQTYKFEPPPPPPNPNPDPNLSLVSPPPHPSLYTVSWMGIVETPRRGPHVRKSMSALVELASLRLFCISLQTGGDGGVWREWRGKRER
jgi:hypothetical protein